MEHRYYARLLYRRLKDLEHAVNNEDKEEVKRILTELLEDTKADIAD